MFVRLAKTANQLFTVTAPTLSAPLPASFWLNIGGEPSFPQNGEQPAIPANTFGNSEKIFLYNSVLLKYSCNSKRIQKPKPNQNVVECERIQSNNKIILFQPFQKYIDKTNAIPMACAKKLVVISAKKKFVAVK